MSVTSTFIYGLLGSDVRNSEFVWRKLFAKSVKKLIPLNYSPTFLNVMTIFLIDCINRIYAFYNVQRLVGFCLVASTFYINLCRLTIIAFDNLPSITKLTQGTKYAYFQHYVPCVNLPYINCHAPPYTHYCLALTLALARLSCFIFHRMLTATEQNTYFDYAIHVSLPQNNCNCN